MYTSLHAHSEFSNLRFLDSTNKLEDLIDKAIQMGLKGLAVTDHESCSGHVRAIQKQKKLMKDGIDFKIILGDEIYLVDSLEEVRDHYQSRVTKFFHFILLAKDAIGGEQIRRISSQAWSNSFYTGKMERVPIEKKQLEEIIGNERGHIIAASACFLPGNKVKTKYGEKDITEITDQDYVLTHTGEWQKVNYPTSRDYNGIGYEIFTCKSESIIRCTENHQFYTFNRNTNNPEWKEAKDLTTRDCLLEVIEPIVYTKNNVLSLSDDFAELVNYRKSVSPNASKYRPIDIQDYSQITPSMMRMFGLWLADGHITETGYRVGFTLGERDFNNYYSWFIKQGLEDLGIEEDRLYINRRSESNRWDISISSTDAFYLFKSLFGISHAAQKHVPERLMHISKDLDAELWYGFMLGDGYFRYRKNEGGEIVCASISKKLIKQLDEISVSLGIIGNIKTTPEKVGKDGVHHEEAYYYSISNGTLGRRLGKEINISHSNLMEIIEDGVYCPMHLKDMIYINGTKFKVKRVQRLNKININEKVYCLNVNNHSFTCQNVVVHNCLGGELAYHILRNDPESCGDFITWCQDTFGDENFYLEMQPSDSEDQVKVNQTIVKISEQGDIPFIVTTDVHYLTKEYSGVHEAYLNSREDNSGTRETQEFYKTCYLMDADEIHEWMDNIIGKENVDTALANTNKIADMVEFFDLEESTHVPDTPIPSFKLRHIFKDWYNKYEYLNKYAHSEDIHDRYLLKLIEDGYEKKIGWDHSQEDLDMYVARIAIELEEMWLVTEKLHESISAYYITTVALIDTMWNEGDSLVGPGRGSIAGMFTAYLIDITTVNPITYGLPHWRHISHTKVELSDVDIDSQANRRKQIVEAVKDKWGRDRVLNSCTFKTEGPKSAILSAARGLGLPSDVASYIATLIPVTRGFTWSLNDCLHGNKEEGRKPVTEFINECAKYDGLIETALSIEGLICGRSIHASAVFMYNENYNVHNAMMKAPNGVEITQFSAHEAEWASGLKEDMLTVKALDKIRLCMDYLLEAGKIEWQGSLKETYYKYFHPDVLDYDTSKMWDLVGEGKVTDLFQFDTSVGKQAIKKIKPRSLVELATASTMMRLMASDGGEQPMDTYVRYKNNINEWYKCMRDQYHLTEDEIHILEEYLLEFHGVGGTQEDVMRISMDPKICNFTIKESNLLRKGIAKKNKDLQKKMHDLVFEKGHEVGTSDNLLNYFWQEVVGKQLGYSFSICHTTVYAMIALTMLNMYYHYGSIFWNCAALSINAGADEELDDNKTTQYGRVAVAVHHMLNEGAKIAPPLIEKCKFGFYPDEKNNQIVYSLKAVNGVGDDAAKAIIDNRPYSSIGDFCKKLVATKLVNNSAMVALCKSGAFTELHSKNRVETMTWWLENAHKYGLSGQNVYVPSEKITMQQFKSIQEMKLYPKELELCVKMANFKKYVLDDEGLYKEYIDPDKKMTKKGYHDRHYILDNNSMPFFKEHFTEDSIVGVVGEFYLVSEKLFTKEADRYIQPLKDWFESRDALERYNLSKFAFISNKLAKGTVSAWEMQAVGYYEDEHELAHLNEKKYGVVDFFSLPEEPKAYDYYTRYINGEPKQIPKMKIDRIAGTVIASDNNHHVVTLLTTHGVVPVKFDKGSYSWYQKQVSKTNEDGSSTILEKSWFQRGTLLLVAGFRRDEQFIPRKYNDSVYKHTVNKIIEIKPNNEIVIQQERASA